jgi:hypothetical protein
VIKKILLYICGFVVLIGINIHYVNKTYLLTKKDSQIKHILADITYINSPQEQFNYSASPFVLGSVDDNVELLDGRVANLKHFFRKYNSPLYDHAALIVKVSDENLFDYRLLPAIAMQESNVCKYIPNDSYNCWGWGIYGNTVTRFSSYEEAIQTVARGIKKEYIDKGMITASSIMEKYTPSSNGSWAHGVNVFLEMLE